MKQQLSVMFIQKTITSIRFPFDTSNLIAYLIAVASQFKMIALIALFVASTTSLGIGSYLLIDSTIRCNKCNLNSINDRAKAEKDPSEVFNQLSEFIQLHSNSKELIFLPIVLLCHFLNFGCCFSRLFGDFCAIFQPMIVVLFTWSVINTCGAMLMIQIEVV